MKGAGADMTGRGVGYAALALCALLTPWAIAAQAGEAAGDAPIASSLAALANADTALRSARNDLPDCEDGCITPGEATVMAFAAGEGEARAGRFLLDIRGGGQSLDGALAKLLFVNSRRDYATLGTLTIAFEREALDALLRRASVCGATDVVDGQITVKACRASGVGDLNMFTMMQRLYGRRIIVEGDVRLQWIDSPIGAPRPIANKRGEREVGYYQVWVHVTDAAQVTFVTDE
jgi:hypothetical protein